MTLTIKDILAFLSLLTAGCVTPNQFYQNKLQNIREEYATELQQTSTDATPVLDSMIAPSELKNISRSFRGITLEYNYDTKLLGFEESYENNPELDIEFKKAFQYWLEKYIESLEIEYTNGEDISQNVDSYAKRNPNLFRNLAGIEYFYKVYYIKYVLDEKYKGRLITAQEQYYDESQKSQKIADALRSFSQSYSATNSSIGSNYLTNNSNNSNRSSSRIPGNSTFQNPSRPNNPCNCKGYDGPGGPCYKGPGGGAYDGPGGPAFRGPGGPCYDGPGGAMYNGPGGSQYSGPGGPMYKGPGGAAYDGPGGPAYSGPGGPCYAGPGGPCYSGPGGNGLNCPTVCE